MKYKLTDTKKEYYGTTLYQIEAIEDGKYAKNGERGGYVEKISNLDMSGNAWVFGNACVFGNAWVFGNACVFGNAWVSDNACVFGNAWVFGKEKINNTDDYICIGPCGSRDSVLTYIKKTKSVSTWCFYGTLKEFEKAVKEKHGNNKYGEQYTKIIKLLKSVE